MVFSNLEVHNVLNLPLIQSTEKFCFKNLGNLEEFYKTSDKFLFMQELPELEHGYINHLNKSITSNDVGAIIMTSPKKLLGLGRFTAKLNKLKSTVLILLLCLRSHPQDRKRHLIYVLVRYI